MRTFCIGLSLLLLAGCVLYPSRPGWVHQWRGTAEGFTGAHDNDPYLRHFALMRTKVFTMTDCHVVILAEQTYSVTIVICLPTATIGTVYHSDHVWLVRQPEWLFKDVDGNARYEMAMVALCAGADSEVTGYPLQGTASVEFRTPTAISVINLDLKTDEPLPLDPKFHSAADNPTPRPFVLKGRIRQVMGCVSDK